MGCLCISVLMKKKIEFRLNILLDSGLRNMSASTSCSASHQAINKSKGGFGWAKCCWDDDCAIVSVSFLSTMNIDCVLRYISGSSMLRVRCVTPDGQRDKNRLLELAMGNGRLSLYLLCWTTVLLVKNRLQTFWTQQVLVRNSCQCYGPYPPFNQHPVIWSFVCKRRSIRHVWSHGLTPELRPVSLWISDLVQLEHLLLGEGVSLQPSDDCTASSTWGIWSTPLFNGHLNSMHT